MKTVIEMAREAGFMVVQEGDAPLGAWYECFTSEIEAFAELVRADAIAKEREACAELCEFWDANHPHALAAAIRARSNT